MIDDVLEHLSPELRKLLTTGSDFVVERQPTPSLVMNHALRGGLAYGRQVLLWGSKSSGKSTFCLQLVADAQRAGKTCAWMDAENSFDPEWARKLGVNTDTLIVSRAHKINDMVDIGTALMQAGVDVLIIDSISALLPAVFFDKKDELKDLAETKQMGAEARDMTQAIKMLNYVNQNTLVILISQQRKKLGSMFVSNIPTGGEAVKFFSSTIIKLFSSESENQAIKGTITVGNRQIEHVIGREVSWLIEANKLGPAYETGKYNLLFDGQGLGVDTAEEIVSMLELTGQVAKSGAWYTVLDQRFHGRDAIVKEVRENSEFKDTATAAIL